MTDPSDRPSRRPAPAGSRRHRSREPGRVPAAAQGGLRRPRSTLSINVQLDEPIAHDPAVGLRPVRRAHRRRHLRRHLGRPRLEDRQHRRHPPGDRRPCEEARPGRRALAGRLLRRQVSLARRHRPAVQAASAVRPMAEETETNQFGTHEFLRFCRLCGVEPYLAANVGTGTPEEFQQWVEYCNAPPGSTSLADERVANGHREPFRVRYWGVGNESWGCGGKFIPEDYCREYRRFAEWLPRVRLVPLPDRRRSQQQRPRLDPAVLRQVGRRGEGRSQGMGAALLLRDDRPRPEIQRGPVVRAVAQGQPDGAAHQGPVGRDGRIRPQARGATDHRRVGELAPGGHRDQPAAPVRTDGDAPRCAGGRAFAGYLQPPRRQGRHGQRGAAREQPALALPGRWRQVRRDARPTTSTRCIGRTRTARAVRIDVQAPELTFRAGGRSERIVPAGRFGLAHERWPGHADAGPSARVRAGRPSSSACSGGSAREGRHTVLTHGEFNAHNTFEHPDIVTPRTSVLEVPRGRAALHIAPGVGQRARDPALLKTRRRAACAGVVAAQAVHAAAGGRGGRAEVKPAQRGRVRDEPGDRASEELAQVLRPRR